MHHRQLASLQVFSCAAGHLSFRLAADELCLTPSAVSHRIRNLESELGFKLFHRYPRQLQLTEEGIRLAKVFGDGIRALQQEIDEIASDQLSGSLTIFARPTITQCWLVPRIGNFCALYPDINLNIRTGNEDVDFRTQQVDVALYYDEGKFPGLYSLKLMEEQMTPVCRPDFAAQHKLQRGVGQLNHCTLLHDSCAWNHASFDAEWRYWAQQQQLTELDTGRGLTFDRSDLAVNAAIHGMGVAMGRMQLVQKRLQSGELVAPYPELKTQSPSHYYGVCPHEHLQSARVMALLRWLQQQVSPE